jgi:hypothetical protein
MLDVAAQLKFHSIVITGCESMERLEQAFEALDVSSVQRGSTRRACGEDERRRHDW